jgi:arylsulfatase A-like enzyme
MDEQMGRLRATLEKHGVAENTMIWFCSDNGPEGNANAPGRTGGLKGRKRSLYEGGVRVPGLLLWPEKISVPRVVKMPACTSDYFPTVLSVLGYRLPDEVAYPSDGIDLVPLIDGRMTERPQPIGFEFRKQISLTGNRFKLYSKDGGESYELYDLIADQNETTNLAANKRKIVQAMSAKLRAWRDSCRKSAAGDDYR